MYFLFFFKSGVYSYDRGWKKFFYNSAIEFKRNSMFFKNWFFFQKWCLFYYKGVDLDISTEDSFTSLACEAEDQQEQHKQRLAADKYNHALVIAKVITFISLLFIKSFFAFYQIILFISFLCIFLKIIINFFFWKNNTATLINKNIC